MFIAAALAVTVGLTTASCSDDGTPTVADTPSAAPPSAAGPVMTAEEAYQKLPMDGTKDLPITWEPSGAPETDEVLAARRALVLHYWLFQATDWPPIIQVGRQLYSDRYYQKLLAPYADPKPVDNPSVGPIWIKYMGSEPAGSGKVMVTFCADLGYWHGAKETGAKVREERAILESYLMEQTPDQRWVADGRLDNHVDLEPKYGDDCAEFAKHKP
ncbi:hypothetical protein [Actinoplanes sp. G11-F43]|uniref:hypothetical protein n=1 Tax=Actinoplanes sp. G11-F43 TaxID=3424130 RepID=UPI003D331D7B